MNTTTRRIFTAPFIIALIASPLFVNCAGLPKAPGGLGDLPTGIPKCPDTSSLDALASFNFEQEFSLKAASATKLKGAASASIEMGELSAKIDADLLKACSSIAADFDAKGDFKDGTTACQAAIKAIGDMKAKMGASARVGISVKPPVCRADLSVAADCAAKCDVSVTPGSAKFECEPGKVSGECSGSCSGTCEASASAACTGECKGTCDAQISGTCSGTCNGSCDGKASNAACAGKCEGKCEGGTITGTCKGKCGGSCQMSGGAKCEGSCTGKCSVEFKSPKCTGEVKPPQMSAECKASCDAKIQAKAECSPASVGIVVVGSTDVKLAERFKTSIEKNLPLILKVAIGMKDTAPKIAANGKIVIEGVAASIKDIAQDAGGKAAMTAGQITGCLGATFKGAAAAAGSISANVDVSVKVNASVSGSASGGGAAGGKTQP